ncbi:MAG: hypothetical protein R2707_01535 [Acidimicrobiales bacterium]
MRTDDRPLWALWLFGLLVAALVAQATAFRPNDVDTGLVVESPGFEPARLLDAEYYHEVDGWIESSFALRGVGLRARAAVDYELLGDSTDPEHVVVGNDGWLFYAEYLNPDCDELRATTPPNLDTGGENAFFVVTPPKAAYHADQLPEPEESCVAEARTVQRASFAPQTIDLDTGLRTLADAGTDVFLRDDTHWSMEARVSVARTIVESLSEGLWRDDLAVGPVQRPSALLRLLGIRRTESFEGPVSVSTATVTEDRIFSAGDLLVLQASEADEDDVVPGVTYLVGDSQMSYVIPLLAPYFEDLRFVNWLMIEGFGYLARDWPDPDRIIVQTIEHEAASRMANTDLASYLERLPG